MLGHGLDTIARIALGKTERQKQLVPQMRVNGSPTLVVAAKSPARLISDLFRWFADPTIGRESGPRVFVLGEGESAARLKLMEVPDVETKESDNAFVHSQLGVRYLTIFVEDMNAAVERARAGGCEPIAEGPVLVGEDPSGPYVAVVRDPDGNMIELFRPKL